MAFFCCYCGCKVDKLWLYCPICGKALPQIEDTRENLKKQETNEIKKPTFPRKIERSVFEARLMLYRLRKATDEHKYPLCIFEDNALNELLKARNKIIEKQDLYKVKYWGEYRIQKYGDDIISILNELDYNYIQKNKTD